MASNVVDFSFIARPNCSLSTRGMLSLVALITLVSLTIAVAFTIMGAWLILPFAGLELAALAYAFYFIHCHSHDYESIRIDEDLVAIEKHDYKITNRIIFQRYWAQVLLQDLPNGEQSLFLRSHGKKVQLGESLMNNEQRQQLARQLKQLVGSAY